MSERPSPRSLSLFGRSWRALVLVAALAAAYLASVHTLANAMGNRAASRAAAMAPWDARITARYARSLISAKLDSDRLFKAEALARRALRNEGTSIDAVVALGVIAQLRRDEVAARNYMTFAHQLSRRDLQTHLWAIEDAVQRGDVPGALRHYDLALRTSRQARDLLYPVLASAIVNPPVAEAAARVMAAQPYWAPDFINFLAKDNDNSRAAAELFARLRTAKVRIPESAEAALTETLIRRGDIERAWSLYRASYPKADRLRSRDPRFVNDKGSRSSFDWQLFGDSGVYTSIERSADGNVLTFSIAPGGAGLLARQMQLLPPGGYTLRSASSRVDLPEMSRPAWELSCQNGYPLGRVTLGNSGVSLGHFDVPQGCPVQYLSLVARPHNASNSVQGQVIEAQLYPEE